MRKAIFIVGMHRSGTSALTGSLVQLGYPMPKNPMPGTPNNPKGHFESTAIWRANDRVLEQLNRTWKHCGEVDLRNLEDRASVVSGLKATVEDEFGKAPKIAIKDPRISLLLPLWLEVCDELQIAPSFVLMRRNPEEVAASLRRRDGMGMLQGYFLWARYTLDAERHTRGTQRIGVESAKLLAEPLETLEKLAMVIGDEEMQAAIDNGRLKGFVEPGLMTQLPHIDRPERQMFDSIFSSVSQVALPGQTDPQEMLEHLDRAATNLAVPARAIDDLQDQVIHLDVRCEAVDRKVAALGEELTTAREALAAERKALTEERKALTEERAKHSETRQTLNDTQLLLSYMKAEDTRVRSALVDARTKPIRNLRHNIAFNVLTSISGPKSKLPERMRERFKRSAMKRAPKRDAKQPKFGE